jgi:hypothetical protein
LLLSFAALVFATPAWSQGNLDAGKSPARIFSDTCASCHRNVRDVKRTNAGFLRNHYTTGPVEANAMANYLAGVANEPREPREPRPPAPAPAAAAQRPTPPAEVTPEFAPALVAPPRQPAQPKAAQATASKKGRVGAEPRGAPPALIITDASSASSIPELPLPPPPAPAPGLLLEPFEE